MARLFDSVGAIILAAALWFSTGGTSYAAVVYLTFTINDGANSGTWMQEATPSPSWWYFNYPTYATLISVKNGTGAFSTAKTVAYYKFLDWRPQARLISVNSSSSGIASYYLDLSSALYGTRGPSDPEITPEFYQGTFNLWSGQGTALTTHPTLTVAPTAPSPLAGSGLLAALALMFGLGLTRCGRSWSSLINRARHAG